MNNNDSSKRLALLSVSDKAGLSEFATELVRHGFSLVSTGGTLRTLHDAGIEASAVEDLTGFPEMMDGRVKTLHPMVHGGILARTDLDTHATAMREHGIAAIDLVCINLYPFRETIAREGVTPDEAIEQIDIGGPAMVRSAAKNHERVSVVTDPAQYAGVLSELDANSGNTTPTFRRRLAADAYAHTAAYDSAVATYLDQQVEGVESTAPLALPALRRDRSLRYGENPHQAAAMYADLSFPGASIAHAEQLHGKELSFNNIADAAAALDIVTGARPLAETHGAGWSAACVVKHTNPCGFAIAPNAAESCRLAIAGDPMAAYGGILAIDAVIDDDAARLIAGEERFFEVVIARSFEADALARLQDRWKNVRLLAVGNRPIQHGTFQFKSIPGGALAQEMDGAVADLGSWSHAAGPKPSAELMRAAAAIEWAGRGLSSNAVCLGGLDGDGVRLFGAGAGQMDRVASCRLAIEKAGAQAAGSIAASDAFFPFPDGPKLLIDAGVTTIVHPGGAKRDQETFELCEAHGVSCLTTSVRRFRH